MSNSDDGFPRSGGSDRTDQTPDGDSSESDSGLKAPSPLGGGSLGGGDSIVDDIDLDDVDFDAIFGEPSARPAKPDLPRSPRLPPPLTRTPERPQPPAIPDPSRDSTKGPARGSAPPKKDPPANPHRRHAQTLMGLSFGGNDSDDSDGGLSTVSSESEFESEKTEIAQGLFGGESDVSDETSTGPFTPSGGLGELGDAIDEISEIELIEDEQSDGSFDDLGSFDAEKTNVAESPLTFPEDAKGEVETNADLPPIGQFDGARTELGVPSEMLPDAQRDSFDEPAPSPPHAPSPDAPNFGFSNFDPAEHASEPQALPNPIGPPLQADEPSRGQGADPEQSFDGEKTELLDSPFENDPLTARIHALEGPAAGQEFFVNNLRNTLGRGTNNTIVVPDVAMSRQHMEIVNNGDGTYALRDLQSVNGTALNGTRIREGDLFHGDRFEGGKSVFQFVLSGANIPVPTNRRVIPAVLQTGPNTSGPPSAEFRAAPGPPSARTSDSSSVMTKIAIGAAIFSIFLIGGVGFLVWQQKTMSDEPTAPSVESTTPSALYLEGVEAVKARDWDQAERSFMQAQAIDPELANVDAQLERIDRERGYMRLLADARDLLDDGSRPDAVEKVAEIPRESVYYEDGQELLRENKKLTVDELYTQAMAAFGRDELDLARDKIEEIRAIVPEHEGASRLEERLDSAEATAETEPDGATERKKSRAATATRKRAKREADDWGFGIEASGSSSSKSGSSKIVNFTRGYALYRSKKFDEAVTFFDDAARESDGTWARRAERTSSEIRKFKTSYEAGIRAYSSGDWKRAEKQLLAARRFDTAVAQNGFFGEELSKKIAGTKARLGTAALNSGDFVLAYKYSEDARIYDSSSRELRELNAGLQRKAKSLYVQAVDKGKTDPAEAAKLCRTIVSMTDAGDDTHRKAKALLKSL